MTADMARIVLTSMLRSHAPDKLANVDELLRLNVGKEEALLQRVAAKYRIGLKPTGNTSTASRTSTTVVRAATTKKAPATTGLAGRVPTPLGAGSASKQKPVEHFSRRCTPGSASTKKKWEPGLQLPVPLAQSPCGPLIDLRSEQLRRAVLGQNLQSGSCFRLPHPARADLLPQVYRQRGGA
eukprot:INCI1519.1.p2 GENE.INCI1519.1~~INCI1519.1.p2  ORF type:complete len:196 (-),score=29.39 INCI1519.1:580-1125(-)